jgi:hypothetical protein
LHRAADAIISSIGGPNQGFRVGRAGLLCLPPSDVNLFRYRNGHAAPDSTKLGAQANRRGIKAPQQLPSSVHRTPPEPARRGRSTLAPIGIRAIDNVIGIVVKTPGTADTCPNSMPSRQFVEIGTLGAGIDRAVGISRPSRRYQSHFGTRCASVKHILVRMRKLERSPFLDCRLAERGWGDKSGKSDC